MDYERERRRQKRYREAMRNRIIAAVLLAGIIVGAIFIIKGCKKDDAPADDAQNTNQPVDNVGDTTTPDNVIVDDELLTLVAEVQQEGGMNEDEGDMLKNSIELETGVDEDTAKLIVWTLTQIPASVRQGAHLPPVQASCVMRSSDSAIFPVMRSSDSAIFPVMRSSDS